jgi:hypothetical protein
MEYAEAYGICLNPTLLSPFSPHPQIFFKILILI